ncbi:MAG: GDP-mannose 4,6-dehydratase, partial [Acidiferrobacterales bacterium]|jgi:GDPmannose 4,6-dehydratase
MKALICGVTGQDGAYLAQLLLAKGYDVWGTSRDAQASTFHNLARLEIRDQLTLVSMAPHDFRSVLQVLSRCRPDEVYNLAGQSSVRLSFEQPVETMESNVIGSLYLLEVIRFLQQPIRLYNACSSECFGDISGQAADESTPFRPRSPYAVAKAAAYWELANYREAYDLFACSGILFNHESPLRPERFVTRKIVAAACRIAAGKQRKLHLGDITIQRDWGWAPEYVEAMWMLLQQSEPDDYVIATGEAYKLEQFVELAFSLVKLDWRDHVVVGATPARPTDLSVGRANPAKAKRKLGWQAKYKMPDVARMMVEAELELQSG